MGANGISVFIDGTFSGFDDVRDLLKLHRIPYFKYDFSIQSVVKLMKMYLHEHDALDAVLIFQDEETCDEALSSFIAHSSLRVILFNQLDQDAIQNLKSLRPLPNYFSIIADTANMKQLFQTVRLILKRRKLFNFLHETLLFLRCRLLTPD